MNVGRFEFKVDPSFRVERYDSSPHYFGVVFTDSQENRYDVVCNPHFGDRLIWNKVTGEWHDIPFSSEWAFLRLPDGITVRLVA